YLLAHEGRRVAYLTDTAGLPGDTLRALRLHPPDLLVLDCTYPPLGDAPRNHNDLTLALETVRALRPARTVLTHIGHEFDAWLMERGTPPCGSGPILPPGVAVGRDGDILAVPT